MNPFDSALEQLDQEDPAPAPAPANPFLRVIDTLHDERQTQLRGAVTVAQQTDPDRRAEALRLAKHTGLPVDTVERNLDDMRKQATIANTPYQQMAAQSPALAEWMQTPNNAAVAHDDLENLGALEWLVTAPQRAVQQGIDQVRFAQLKTEGMFRTLSREERDQLDAYKFGMTNGGALGAGKSWWRQAVTGTGQLLPNIAGGAAMALKYAGAGALATGLPGAAVGSVVPGVGTAAGFTAAAPFGARAGFLYGGGKFGFQLEAGLALDEYETFTDETGKPIDHDVAKAAAMATGLLNAGLEAYGLEKLAESIPGVKQLTGKALRATVAEALKKPTVRAALFEAMKTYGKTLTQETATEVAQRAVTILSGELAKTASGQDIEHRAGKDIFQDLINEGIGAVQGFGLTVAAGPAMHVAHMHAQARAAQGNADFFLALGKGVEASKLNERSPEQLQDLLKRAVENGPAPVVYAPVDTWTAYWQSKGIDPADMATKVTGDSKALETALTSGTDLAIPTERYATTIAPTEHNDYFAQELRMHPDEMNTREALAFQEQEAQAQASADPGQADPVHAALQTALEQAGVPTDTATRYARLVASAVNVAGGTVDRDPYELLGRYGIEIQRPATKQTGRVGAQAATTETPGPAPLEAGADVAGTQSGLLTGLEGSPDATVAAVPSDGIAEVAGAETNAPANKPVETPAETPALAAQAEAPINREDAASARQRAMTRTPIIDNKATGEETATHADRSGAGQGAGDREGERARADEGRAPEGGGDGARTERRRLPSIYEVAAEDAGKPFQRASKEADAARLTPEVLREVSRIADEMAAMPFVAQTWTWLTETAGPNDGNAAGGQANIVGGAAGAPVFDDVMSFSPLNPGKAKTLVAQAGETVADFAARAGVDEATVRGANTLGRRKNLREGEKLKVPSPLAKAVGGDRADVEAAAKQVAATGRIHNNLAEGVVRIAERRAADDYAEISRPMLPPTWGTEATPDFIQQLSDEIDESVAEGALEQDADTSFDPSEFGQGLFDLFDALTQDQTPEEQRVAQVDQENPVAGEQVDGLTVGDNVPNLSSISATFNEGEYVVLPGVREVKGIEGTPSFYSKSEEERTQQLSQAIETSGTIDPLIYVFDAKGDYVLEGGHRLDALKLMGKTSFPAVVVVDVRPQEPAIDTLDTGEQQPRLPAAGDVREQDVQTPQLAEIPFMLTSEENKAVKGKQTTLFQSVFHGSPHDFDAFSTEKIGTGEGAQAYGYGLYFAEDPTIAAGYFDKLGGDPQIQEMRLGSMVLTEENGFNYSGRASESDVENIRASLAEDLLIGIMDLLAVGTGGFQQHVLAMLDQRIENYRTEWPEGVQAAQTLRAMLARPGAVSIKFDAKSGGVYQVHIDDAVVEKMLDWDAPVEKQPVAVKNLLRAALKKTGFLREGDNGPRQLKTAFRAFSLEKLGMIAGTNGGAIYEAIAAAHEDHEPGLAAAGESQKRASKDLLAAGVPGIKYLDASSRDGEKRKKTRNLVVFNDQDVTITHKDGTPVSAQERREYFQDKDRGGTQPPDRRGSIRIGPARKIVINLFENADLSTFLHEAGHFFLEMRADVADEIARIPEADRTPQQRKAIDDWQQSLAWMGVANRESIKTEQHEQWAEAFEDYLLEGKAPNLALEEDFSRFRAWMLAVYRGLRGLKSKLSPEIRQVFDRMLATDHEIEQAQARGRMEPMFTTADAAGMTEEQFALYRTQVEDASRHARQQLDAKLLGQVRREQEQLWKTRRAEIQAEVAAGVQQQPVYQALAAIRFGQNADGTSLVEGMTVPPLKLAKDQLIARYGEERVRTLPKPYVYAVAGGVDPELVATRFGFTSADELITAIEQAAPMAQAIDQETARRMIAEHGSLLLDGTIVDAAQQAAANTVRDGVIRAEQRALASLARKVEPFVRQARKEGQRAVRDLEKERAYERRWLEAETRLRIAIAEGKKQAEIDVLEDEVTRLKAQARGGAATIRQAIPPLSAIVATAKERIQRTRVRDLNPAVFWSASRRAATKALDHAARQEFDAAIAAKTQELLNLNLYREAEAAKADVDARVKKVRDLARDAKLRSRIGLSGESFLEQIDGILDRYDFAKRSKKDLDRRARMRDWMEALEAEGLPVEDLPVEVQDDLRRVSWQDVSYAELVGVSDGLAQIVHLSKIRYRELKAADAEGFGEKRDALVESLRAHNDATKLPLEFDAAATRRLAVSDIFASHAKAATLARMMDGHEDGGAMWEAVIRPLNAAADAETDRRTVEGEAYRQIVDRFYPARDAKLTEKVFIPAIGASLTKEGRLAVALNWGNELSRSRLLADPTRRWNQSSVDAILDTLDQRDWEFVQATWDYLDRFWPEIEAKQERVTGLKPAKVEAAPVETKFGTYAGGYYPLAYDGRLVARAQQNEAASEAKLAEAAAYVRTTTKRGHTIARVANVKLSVKLDLGVAFQHIDQVIHDLTHHETLIDVTRVLRDPRVSQAILDTRGSAVYQQFTRLLQDIAAGSTNGGRQTLLDKGATFMRTGAQISLLGWNFWTAAQQPLGLFNGMERVGVRWVAKGMSRWLKDAAKLQSTTTWIAAVSPFMRDRVVTATQDIMEVRSALLKPGGWFDTLVRTVTLDTVTQRAILDSYLWHIGLMQRVADVPTWLGAYEKAKAGGDVDESYAVAQADQAVRDSQGGGQIVDLAQVQRGSPVAKLFMTFYSYGNVVFNQTAANVDRTDFKSPAQIGTLLGHLSLLYLMPALGTVAMANLFGKHHDKDPDDWLKSVGAEMLSTALNTMVLLREATNLVGEGTRGYAGPAGTRAIQLAYSLAAQVKQGDADEALLKAINAAAGIVFRYPSAQVERTVDGYAALAEGRTHNPFALVVGAPKAKRR